MSKDTELSEYLSQPQVNLTEVVSKINAGAKVNVVNHYGNSILHLAILCKAYKLIPSLLSLGADVNKINGAGLTPLQCIFPQQPIDLETAFLLLKEGANPKTVDTNGNNLIHHAIIYGDLSSIAMAIKLGVDARGLNNSGHSPLYSLMSQASVNLDAVALLVLAASGALIKSGSLILPLIKHHHTLDLNNLCTISYPYLDPRAALILGKYNTNKEKVFEYIKSLPSSIQKELVNQSLDKETFLGAFFSVQRGMCQTSSSSGMLEQLMKLKKKLNQQIDPSSVSAVQSDGPSQKCEPSAPPYIIASQPYSAPAPQSYISAPQPYYASILATSDYNPLIFASAPPSSGMVLPQSEYQTEYRKT